MPGNRHEILVEAARCGNWQVGPHGCNVTVHLQSFLLIYAIVPESQYSLNCHWWHWWKMAYHKQSGDRRNPIVLILIGAVGFFSPSWASPLPLPSLIYLLHLRFIYKVLIKKCLGLLSIFTHNLNCRHQYKSLYMIYWYITPEGSTSGILRITVPTQWHDGTDWQGQTSAQK